MENYWNEIVELINSPDVNFVGAGFKLVLALLLGGAIGLERRRKGQTAGLRTFALITTGAALAMLISIYIPQVYFGLKNGDPGRIAAQVVSGVGFLGAGAIIQMKGSVRGLTTAAGIWMAACIGLAVGAGMYWIAVTATALIIFILWNIERVERKIHFLWETKVVRVKLHGTSPDIDACIKVFASHGVKARSSYMKCDYENDQTIVNFTVLGRDSDDYSLIFSDLHKQLDTISVTLTNEPNL